METLLVRLQRAVAPRFAVEHELGRGGMAVVLLGHDLKLNRRVAIKVLERGDGLIAGVERFLSEIRIVAQLHHPNILPVFDSGEGENLVYYVMPYVAGGSLQERLKREGPLPIADAVRIAREVAEALDHAHRAGIVHRDIKPGNIMLADGVAVVADFGIARAIEASGGRITATGLALGTPAYMSPEQATASIHIDGRADLYALGCVLYEMLAGIPPFDGPTGQIVMARHVGDKVPSLQTIREVPRALEAVMLKSLAKIPGDRWPTARTMADELASTGSTPSVAQPSTWDGRKIRLAAAAGALLLAGVATVLSLGPKRGVPAATPVSEIDSLPSLAVLPFIMIGDSSHAPIASGLTEAVITAFVRTGGLRIPGQSTVERYAGRDQDPVAIGRELRVENVLVGSVQASRDTLRVTTRLVRVADGTLRWSDSYDGDMFNVFAMQDNITRRIIDALQVQLTPAGRSVLARGVGTRNETAYTLYTVGRSLYARADPVSLHRAVDYFKQSAAQDTSYAAPLVGLIDTYDLLENVDPGRYRVSGADARELIRRAVALDPMNGDARAHLASRRYWACDSSGAERELRAAIRLSPGSSELRRNYALFLGANGRFEEALAASRDAATIDPSSPWVLAVLAHSYSLTGRHDSALSTSARALALDSTQWVSRAVHGSALSSAGRPQDGIPYFESARRLGGSGHGFTTAQLGWAYARAGRRQDAEGIARLLGERVARGEATRWQVAYVYAGLGDREKAFEWLAKAPQRSDWKQEYGYWLPMLDPLRSDPRFELLAKPQACLES